MPLAPLTLLRPATTLRLGILTFQERQALGADLPVPAHAWEFPSHNAAAILADFHLLTQGRNSQPLPAHVQATQPDNIFLEAGSRLEHCSLHASDGPIYIAAGALVMDGARLRGPLSIGARTVVKMNAALYGGTSIGPDCIVGGEVKNSILMEGSNKAHEGYLGDSVVGAWCNIGAGTSTSNIRNTGNDVPVWDMDAKAYASAGLKLGLVMGDCCRTAIHTAFNTGTVVGTCAHVFGHPTLTPKHIPSFAWGTDGRYALDNLLLHITNWMSFKGQTPSPELLTRIQHLYQSS